MHIGGIETGGTADTVRPITRMWPNLNLLGIGAWWGWIWLCYNSTVLFSVLPLEAHLDAVRNMYLVSTPAIALAMLAAAMGWRRVTRLVDSNRLLMAVSLVAGASTFVLPFVANDVNGALYMLFSLLTGLGTSVLCLRSGRLYGKLGLTDIMTSGGIALAFSCLVYFVGVGLVEWPRFGGLGGVVFTATLPLVSAGLMCLGNGDPYESSGLIAELPQLPDAGIRSVFTRLVVASAVISFVDGMGQGVSSMVQDSAFFATKGIDTAIFALAVAVMIVAVVNVGGAMRALKGAYTGLMLLAIAILLMASAGLLHVPYIGISKESLWLLFSCIMAYLAFRFDVSSVRLFGFGQAAYFACTTAGWVVGTLLGPWYETDMGRIVVCGAGAFLLIVVQTVVFRMRDIEVIRMSRPGGAPAGLGVVDLSGVEDVVAAVRARDAAGLAARAQSSDPQIRSAQAAAAPNPSHDAAEKPLLPESVVRRYALSSRELEILSLFARGRSANWIAEALTISNNTVRSHLRSVYVKLDVHTRQDLIDFIAKNQGL